jgi:hypothetical protein
MAAETFVTVRWAWLAFVAAQVGLSIMFLVCVCWHTRHLGVDVVKSSNTAALFALGGLSSVSRGTGGIRSLVGNEVRARLQKANGRWELDVSGKDSADPTHSRVPAA